MNSDLADWQRQLLKCFNKIIEIITFNAFLKIVKGIVVW